MSDGVDMADPGDQTAEFEQSERDDDASHLNASSGHIVHFPNAELPYKVVLEHPGRDNSDHDFATMRESEDFLRRNTPTPPARSTLVDRGPGEA